MSVLWGELRKLLWWRNLLLVLAVGGIYYWVFAWSQVGSFPNGHPMTEDHELALAWHEEFGPSLDPDEIAVIESRLAEMVGGADAIIESDPVLRAAGLHGWHDVIVDEGGDPAVEQVVWELLLGDDGPGWKIQSASWFLESYGPVLRDPVNQSPAQLVRIEQINQAEEWRSLQSPTLLDFLTAYLAPLASLLFLVNVLLAAPLVTTDRVNQVRQLQAASATGRRLLRVQLAVTSGVSIIATAVLIGLTSLPLARFGFDAFWGTGIQSFTSASLYPSVTLGQYCWLLAGLLMIVGILAALIGFILSRANRGYPTLSISLMVALALGFPTLSKMLGTSPALSYESPLGRVLGTPFATMLALSTLAAAALAVCLIQVRRERGIDVEDQ